MWEKCDLAILFDNNLNNSSNLFLDKSNKLVLNKLNTNIQKRLINMLEYKNANLYVLSDESIKEGDWIGYPTLNTWIPIKYLGGDLTGREKKIIATNDKNIIINTKCETYKKEHCGGYCCGLSQLPSSFIEHYIFEYNQGNMITKIMVEFEERFIPLHESVLIDGVTKVYWLPEGVCSEYTYYKNGEVGYMISKGRANEYSTKQLFLKTISDNIINIKTVKKNLSREEVLILFGKAQSESIIKPLVTAEVFNEWFEKNL